MKKINVLVFIFVALLFGCGNSSNAQDHVFGLGQNYIGIVIGNNLKVYAAEDSLRELADYALPNGYKSVFGLGQNYIGVVVGNNLKVYAAEDSLRELADYVLNTR